MTAVERPAETVDLTALEGAEVGQPGGERPAVDLSVVLDRLDTLASELDLEPVRRCIVELVRIADHQPLAERVEELGRQLLGPVQDPAVATLTEEIARQQSELRQLIVDRLEWLTAAVGPGSLERAVQRSQAPLLKRLEQLGSERATIVGQPVGFEAIQKAVSGLRSEVLRAIDRQLASSSRTLAERFEAGARSDAVDRAALAERLEGLGRALEHVELDVGRDMTRISAELVGIKDELAHLAGSAEVAVVLDKIRELGEAAGAGAPGRVLAEIRSLAAAPERSAVLERLDALDRRIARLDPAPVAERIESLRRDLPRVDLQPLTERLEALRGELPAVDLAPVLERLEALKDQQPAVDLTPVTDRLAEMVDRPDVAPVVQSINQAVTDLGLGQAVVKSDLRNALSVLDQIREHVDRGPLLRDLAQIRAVLDDHPWDRGIEQMQAALDQTGRLEELRTLIGALADGPALASAGLERLDARSDRLDERLERLERSIDELPGRIGREIAAALAGVDARVAALDATGRTVAERLEGSAANVEAVLEAVQLARFSEADRRRADDAARQQTAAQLAEMSERILALRRRLAVRAPG